MLDGQEKEAIKDAAGAIYKTYREALEGLR
jgi:hypothetical protein